MRKAKEAMMKFANRTDAGLKLGQRLIELGTSADLVLGLPRGGVVVAKEVAHILNCPLDVIVVRKIGHPHHREFAVGALAEDGTRVFHNEVIRQNELSKREIERVIAEETERLRAYRARFHQRSPPDLKGRRVVIVDDGLATGATMEVAILSARKQHAQAVTLAVPVASEDSFGRLSKQVDHAVALIVDPYFEAVGHYYYDFGETSDSEVVRILDF